MLIRINGNSLRIFTSLLFLFIIAQPEAFSQWLDWSDETDTRLVLSSVANSDDEEKDFWNADLNNDGAEDVIVVRKEPFSLPSEPPKSDLLLMNVDGVLTDQTSLYAPEFISNPTFARDVYVGDFDNDGWQDVVIANTFEQQPLYFRNLGNDGNGNWLGLVDESSSRFPEITVDVPLICAVWGGDITGNGSDDIYFVNYKVNAFGGTAKDFLLINDGTGHFTEEGTPRLGDLRNSAFGTAVQIHDLDNDGDQDVIKVSTLYSVAPWNEMGTFILFNDGTGNFSNWQNLTPSSSPYMFDVADFNDDGQDDIYVVDDQFDYVLTITGSTPDTNIAFNRTTLSYGSVGGFGGNVHVADLDLDGDMDVAVADVDVDIPPCNSGRRMAIFENSSGSMSDPYGNNPYDWADNSYDFSLLDINGDGLIDIITGGCSGYNVFMNDNCSLVQSSADFDLDGLPDACDPCPTNPNPDCQEPLEYPVVSTDHSMARQWNDLLLESIRRDFARPTVHARNLFHHSSAMWDAWAAFDDEGCTYLLGQELNGFNCAYAGIPLPSNVDAARDTAIAYASYRLLNHRFASSPGAGVLMQAYDAHMATLGYDATFNSIDYSNGSAAALGNYIAQCYIDYGLNDGSNELNGYENAYYTPVNPPLIVDQPGNPTLVDLNRWQPLTLDLFIDQSGNPIPGDTPDFLSPEWGAVHSFSLVDEDKTTYQRDGFDYEVYHDPGTPPMMTADGTGSGEEYVWNFLTTAIWSGHLDPTDGVMWDISPASLGNRNTLPSSLSDLDTFYNQMDGGTTNEGHDVNPATGAPYAPNMVPRGDYARILAEFWADGPDSETPPGHWFTLLNYVSDHPDIQKQFMGTGPVLNDLEWDVKSYFSMGGAMHDAAVASWGVKGWYDYIRPVSAIRGMAEKGQSTDPLLPNYHPQGLPLISGKLELIQSGDDLAGDNDENVNKLKIWAWRGHKAINNVDVDEAGVGWILVEEWEPYQRPSFVTPPFAGYVSGHSTYSRAAAEVLEALTGDEYFPGGMGVFVAEQDEFLVFEDGPSQTIELQWATYQDAADESAQSRIWGGIHPPCDDVPGRLMGIEIGQDAFDFAKSYFGDSDNDGICDRFDALCPEDLNSDNERNVADLIIFLSYFGCTGQGCTGDFNNDGTVNTSDLAGYMIQNYGIPCN